MIASPHRMGRFDGMTDSYNVDNARDDIPQVSVRPTCRTSHRQR